MLTQIAYLAYHGCLIIRVPLWYLYLTLHVKYLCFTTLNYDREQTLEALKYKKLQETQDDSNYFEQISYVLYRTLCNLLDLDLNIFRIAVFDILNRKRKSNTLPIHAFLCQPFVYFIDIVFLVNFLLNNSMTYDIILIGLRSHITHMKDIT